MGDIKHIESQFALSDDESLGILTDLGDSMLPQTSDAKTNDTSVLDAINQYTFSSILREPETTEDYDYDRLKSRTNYDQRRHRVNKYDHVQSKVKLYREEIQRQQKQRKRESVQDRHKQSIHADVTGDSDANSQDSLKQLEDFQSQYHEVKLANDLLMKQNLVLIEEKVKLQTRVDFMRLEMERYKDMVAEAQKTKTETPRSRRFFFQGNSQLSLLRTPIRTLSRTILSPFKDSNVNNMNSPNYPNSATETESESDSGQEYEISERCLNKTKEVRVCEHGSPSSAASDVPLVGSVSPKISNAAKCFLFRCLPCSKTPDNDEEKLDVRFKKFRKRKLHPIVEVSPMNTPTELPEFRRSVSMTTSKNNLRIPMITISTPTDNLGRIKKSNPKNVERA